MPEMVPSSSRFPTTGQGERRLWERDWLIRGFTVNILDHDIAWFTVRVSHTKSAAEEITGIAENHGT